MMNRISLLLIANLFFGGACFSEKSCEYKMFAEKIEEGPRWHYTKDHDGKRDSLESLINDLLLVEPACLRKIVNFYYENYLKTKSDEEKLATYGTFFLIFYAYCNVPPSKWEEYTGPFRDTQSIYDPTWNPGDPWLIEFEKEGVKIIGFPFSYGGSFGNLEERWNIAAYFEEVYSKYGKRDYLPKR